MFSIAEAGQEMTDIYTEHSYVMFKRHYLTAEGMDIIGDFFEDEVPDVLKGDVFQVFVARLTNLGIAYDEGQFKTTVH